MPYSYGDSAGITPASLLILRIEAEKPNSLQMYGDCFFTQQIIQYTIVKKSKVKKLLGLFHSLRWLFVN